MWVVKEAVIKALWQQVHLLPSRIEVLPDGNRVQVAVLHEAVPVDWQISVEVSYPDDQVMAVVRIDYFSFSSKGSEGQK
jgi:phosphopantetheinyl transferase (holo-ACP synthase)